MRLPLFAAFCLLTFSLFLIPPPCSAQSAPAAPAPSPNYVSSLNHLLHWPQFPVRVFIAGHDSTEIQQGRIAQAGFDSWVKATGGAARYIVVNSPAASDITVRFVPEPSLPGKPIRLGSTQVVWSGSTLKKATIEIATGEMSAEELQSVAGHEFGHALGIEGHSDKEDDLMFPTETRYFLNDTLLPAPPRSVTQRDLNTLKGCYPALFCSSS